ncbi:hypothetical protein P4284_23955 [Bacillus swezeyi]|uniref:Bacteriophage SP-beta YorD domain-containing protein n=1 Tax=Bacillus swezeyi TaxID=1925020 RepID=A0A5M8RYA6_9BACI|nr:hypothetical protein [Bacillus swezeyi]KAA6452711.1 hypothetical protein DX927_00325 [Bacillus swezeyi]KAA6472264.1 hypothetical protein DX928_22845 [Bacillus swezeyi]MED2945344.1 hypothetical protein [Bacillus swezeyi]MED2979708.1 hypothetical protein [Bacillus swezeyi]TYS38078.1 hypothetical protein FZC77_00245 [Bacillus swezeyi]
MHVLFYDASFKYAGEDDININLEEDEELPSNCTTTLISEDLIDPKYDPKKNKWVEAATPEYIEKVKPTKPEPSELELLKKQNALLSYQLAQLQAEIQKLKGGAAS